MIIVKDQMSIIVKKNKKCIRKSTCKINKIFNEKTESCENKKCKAVLEYYTQHK